MLKRITLKILPITGILSIIIITPLISGQFLGKNTNHPWIILLACSISMLYYIKFSLRSNKIRIAITSIILLALIFSSAAFLVLLAMIPFEAYKAWIHSSPKATGTVALIFFITSVWFSCISSLLVKRFGFLRAIGALILMHFLLIPVITNSYLMFFIACGLCIVFLYINNLVITRLKLSYIRHFIFVFLFTIIASAAIMQGRKDESGWLSFYSINSNIKVAAIKTFPKSSIVASLGGYGLFYGTEAFGGKPAYTDVPIVHVWMKPGTWHYFRTNTYDFYDGKKWLKKITGPVLADPVEFNKTPDKSDISMIVFGDYLPTLPFPLSSSIISVKSNSAKSISLGNKEEGFVFDTPLLTGDVISITQNKEQIHSLKWEGKTFDTEVMKADHLSPSEREKYLHTLKSSLLPKLAATLISRNKGIPGTVENIMRYLADNMIFSVNTTPPKEGEDLVENFLFTSKKGYSVHYASSFTMLARFCGIPARYVEGFTACVQPGKESVHVTTYNSHAWSEIFIDRVGWVRIETMALFLHNGMSNGSFWAKARYDRDSLSAKQLSIISGQELVKRYEKPKIDKNYKLRKFIRKTIPAAIFFLLGGTTLALLYFLIQLALREYRLRDERPLHRMRRYLNLLVRYFDKYNVPHPEKIGWKEWSIRTKKCTLHKESVAQLEEMVSNAVYSKNGLSSNILKQIVLLSQSIRSPIHVAYEVRKLIHPPRWAWILLFAIALTGLVLRIIPLLQYGGPLGYFIDYDEGVYFSAAKLLFKGVLPYRDFVIVHPPGLMYVLGLLSSFNTDLASSFGQARLLMTFLGAVNISLIGAIVMRRSIFGGIVAALLYATFPESAGSERGLFLEPVLNFACILTSMVWLAPRKDRSFIPFVAGILFGFAFSVKIWAGAWLIAILFTVPGRSENEPIRFTRELFLFFTGAALSFLVLVGPLFFAAPVEFIKDTLLFHLNRPPDGYPDIYRLPLIVNRYHIASFVLAVIAIIHIIVRLFSKTHRATREEYFFSIAWILTLVAFMKSPTYWPQYNAFLALSQSILAGFGALLLWESIRKKVGPKTLILIGIVSAALLFVPSFYRSVKDISVRPSWELSREAQLSVGPAVRSVVGPDKFLFTFEPGWAIPGGRLPSIDKNAPIIVDTYAVMLMEIMKSGEKFQNTDIAFERSKTPQKEIMDRVKNSQFVIIGGRGAIQLNSKNEQWIYRNFHSVKYGILERNPKIDNKENNQSKK